MTELATHAAEALTEEDARRALTSACQRLGRPSTGGELIRIGSNAVFRVDGDTIARVAPSRGHQKNARKQIDVARWLARVGYPAVRALNVEQPVEANGRVVTFWESIAPETRYAPIGDVARLIRRLHDLDSPADVRLPDLQPFGAPGAPLPNLPSLPADDANFLHDRIEWARSRFPELPYVLPRGVVHGDANVGNVLVDPDGLAVLIDLDGFSVGPREWDLIQTALFADRLGWHSRQEYEEFVEVYGYDVMAWSGYDMLADMREVAMTTWLCKKAAGDPATSAEAAKRVKALRSGCSRVDWGAF